MVFIYYMGCVYCDSIIMARYRTIENIRFRAFAHKKNRLRHVRHAQETTPHGGVRSQTPRVKSGTSTEALRRATDSSLKGPITLHAAAS